jgi:putative ABC transport system permease protein
MQTLIQDIRYAVRSLIKRPSFVLIAVTTLAFGIGANTAIFTVVNAVLLRPLPYPEPERLVVFEGINPSRGIPASNMSVPDFADWRNQTQSFEKIGGFVTGNAFLVSSDESERVRGTWVTEDYFGLLRTPALKGRVIQADDYKEGGENVAVLSYGLWLRRFGGSDSVIGSKVMLSNTSTTVIGVMPPTFDYPTQTDVWSALSINPAKEERDNRFLNVVARLKNGVPIDQAQAEMNIISDRLAKSYVQTNLGWEVRVSGLQDRMVGNVRASLWVLLGAVGLVLLIACANVANLQLARATYRKREIAVRTALGANRLRIVRQLLTESLLLSVISGVIGIALSFWLTKLLIGISPADAPRFDEVRIDGWVLAFAFAAAVLTGLIFGLVPAVQTSQADLNETLKESGRTGTHSSRNRIGSALMVSEIALSFMLLVGAGLLIKSFMRLREVNPGFTADKVLSIRASLPPGKYKDGEPRAQMYRQIIEKIEATPGVSSAGGILSLPLGADAFNLGRGYIRQGDPATTEYQGDAAYLAITPRYFETLQIPLKAGRVFSDRDTDQAPKVVIVNETMARQLWPGESPIGRRIWIWRDEKVDREIVGVVGDTRTSIDTDPGSQLYIPFAQDATWGLALVIRTTEDPSTLAPVLRNQIRSVDKGIALYNVRTLEDIVATSMAPRRTPMLLLSSFAAVAMLLAMLGIYGVTAYYVTNRTHEIGVRIALGAQFKDVLTLVLTRGVALAITGIAIGVVGAFALTRYLTTLLFGVRPLDWVTFAVVAFVLVVVALLACAIPARRAAKVDPLIALRYE